jgi:chemotaxis response regulator CheB
MNLAIVHASDAVRHALEVIASGHRHWQVIWEERDAVAAVRRCAERPPDVLLLQSSREAADATRRIMSKTPCAVVLVARRRDRDAASVFEAMSAGAVDVALEPSVDDHGRLAGEDLVRTLQTAERLLAPAPPRRVTGPAPRVTGGGRTVPPLVVIGASTGGPAAIARVAGGVPATAGIAIAIVQHVGAEFCGDLARWLGAHVRLPVRVGAPGDRLSPGIATLIGGSDDLVITRELELAHRRASRDSFYHPSIDVFCRSVADHWPRPGLGILLTGIGRDGAEGLLALRNAGWATITQDAESSVVYGMPKAAVEIDAADQVLGIDQIAAAVQRFAAAAATGRSPS